MNVWTGVTAYDVEVRILPDPLGDLCPGLRTLTGLVLARSSPVFFEHMKQLRERYALMKLSDACELIVCCGMAALILWWVMPCL